MNKQYNSEMPSTSYDAADFAALQASNITPALAGVKQCRFDSAEDASIFFAREGNFVPNAPVTIRKKGSSKPLIDTGRMRQSVNYVIQQKGEGDE